MSTIGTWGEIIGSSFKALWISFVAFIPNLFGAFLVLIIGWFIAVSIAKLAVRLTKALKFDYFLEKCYIKGSFEKAGMKFDFANVVGWLVKWFLIVVFFIAAADILNLEEINIFLRQVVLYIPNVVIAIVILFLGFLLGNFVSGVVKKSLKAARLVSSQFLVGISKWAIILFSFMAALVQLGVAASLIQILFVGFVMMMALAGGLAFGFGGRELAEDILERLQRDIREKKK